MTLEECAAVAAMNRSLAVVLVAANHLKAAKQLFELPSISNPTHYDVIHSYVQVENVFFVSRHPSPKRLQLSAGRVCLLRV